MCIRDRCIIYKLIKYPQLKELLENEQVRGALEALRQPDYYDPDILFDEARNCDYSHASGGLVKQQFINHFHPFIRVCVEQQRIEVSSYLWHSAVGGKAIAYRLENVCQLCTVIHVSCFPQVDSDPDSFLVVLCFAYSLLGRRMFFQHAQHGAGRRG